MSLTARHLEANGIPTLIIGSARDIVDEIAVPRFAFTDLPLGNPVGPSGDAEQQRRILTAALRFAEAAVLPQSSVIIPVEWSGAQDWRESYMSLADPAALASAGDERRARQATKKS